MPKDDARVEQSDREAAAIVFDRLARNTRSTVVCDQNRHHAKVIRAGEGDDYDAVQAALNARLQHSGKAAAGYVMVPREPTVEMLIAGDPYVHEYARDAWSAMLVAAPSPTGESRQPEPAAPSASDDRIKRLEAALRCARGWVITCSESPQARRDLKTIDAALALTAHRTQEAE